MIDDFRLFHPAADGKVFKPSQFINKGRERSEEVVDAKIRHTDTRAGKFWTVRINDHSWGSKYLE